MLRASAAQNGVFAVVANKAGKEKVKGRTARYFGLSCMVDPAGRVEASAPKFAPNRIVKAKLDLSKVERQRRSLFIFGDRRPELYHAILGQPR